MKTTLIILVLILSSILAPAQLVRTDSVMAKEKPAVERYVIGIAEESKTYFEVYDFLEASPYVKIIAYCTQHQVIAVKVLDEEFKSYDEFIYYIDTNLGELTIFRKDFDIFTKDCESEYLKQK